MRGVQRWLCSRWVVWGVWITLLAAGVGVGADIYRYRASASTDVDTPSEVHLEVGSSRLSTAKTLNQWADDALTAMIETYWNPEHQYFHKFSDRSGWTDFWWEAQLWDTVMDGVVRTRGANADWRQLLDQVYRGQARRNPTFMNQFYDDEAWWALASLRAYEITQDPEYLENAEWLWNDIRSGWSDDLGGGIWWRKDERNTKNACINGPAAILAVRLYQFTGNKEDLEMAERIYAWLRQTLLADYGLVEDNIDRNGRVDDHTYTYNQGTFIGAAVGLYQATGEAQYLEDAKRVANASLAALVDWDGILKESGNGDGGGFKAIFARYLVWLIKALPESESEKGTRDKYVQFLVKNAVSVWENGRNDRGLFSSRWAGPPPAAGTRVESLTNASAVALLNLTADLVNELGLGY